MNPSDNNSNDHFSWADFERLEELCESMAEAGDGQSENTLPDATYRQVIGLNEALMARAEFLYEKEQQLDQRQQDLELLRANLESSLFRQSKEVVEARLDRLVQNPNSDANSKTNLAIEKPAIEKTAIEKPERDDSLLEITSAQLMELSSNETLETETQTHPSPSTSINETATDEVVIDFVPIDEPENMDDPENINTPKENVSEGIAGEILASNDSLQAEDVEAYQLAPEEPSQTQRGSMVPISTIDLVNAMEVEKAPAAEMNRLQQSAEALRAKSEVISAVFVELDQMVRELSRQQELLEKLQISQQPDNSSKELQMVSDKLKRRFNRLSKQINFQ